MLVQGQEVEFAGAAFGQNQKNWDLNTQHEEESVKQLIANLEPLVSDLVSYELHIDEPHAHDGNPDLVDINATVIANGTDTYDTFNNEIKATLKSLSLTKEQIQQGQQLGKNTYEFNYTGRYILRSKESCDRLQFFLKDINYYLEEFQLKYNTSEKRELPLDYKQHNKSPFRYEISMTLPIDFVSKITGFKVIKLDYDNRFKNYAIPFPTDLWGTNTRWRQPLQGKFDFELLRSRLWRVGVNPLNLLRQSNAWGEDLRNRYFEEYPYLSNFIDYLIGSGKEKSDNVIVVPMKMESGRPWCIVYINDDWESLHMRCEPMFNEIQKYRVAIIFERMSTESEADFIKWCEKYSPAGDKLLWSHRKQCSSYYLDARGCNPKGYFSEETTYYVKELNYY